MRLDVLAGPAPAAAGDEAALREALYAGGIYLVPPSPASLALADHAEALLGAAFPEVPPRRAHMRLPVPVILGRLTAVRARLREADAIAHATAVLAAAGFSPPDYHRDVPRLRAVLPGGHLDPAAAPAYTPHRDTWFANPQAQINLWVALHDAAPHETFYFYPSLLEAPVDNDSEDYATFIRRVGWQRQGPPPDAVYPTVRAEPRAPRLGFAYRRGQVLLFAAAHLHGTGGILADGLARFSVDFRVAHGDDHRRGRGPRNVDNRSRGAAIDDYAPPG